MDYTIIRPAWLTNDNEVNFETTTKNQPFGGTEVSRKSVAEYVLSIIENPQKDMNDSIGVNKPGTAGERPRVEVMEANGFDPNM